MAVIEIAFGKHVPAESMQSMVSGVAAYGNVFPKEDARSFRCEVFRASKLPALKHQLMEWDRYGFLRWREVS